MKMNQQATSHQQHPPCQKTDHRKAEREGNDRGKDPGEGGRGRTNVSEESQDK